MIAALAPVDAIRALPAPLALVTLRQLEAELGPEAVAALGTAWDFWRRPSQRFPTDAELRRYHTIVYTGDFGAGKTRCAWELLVWLIVTGRARGSRIVAATGAAAREIVTDDDTGILAWKQPGVAYEWESSKGYEGELRVNGVLVSLCSIEAPKSLTGSGRSAELLDDPPKWGPTGKAALVNAMRSTRQPGALTIIPTTLDGLALIAEVNGTTVERLADVGVLVIDLGRTEDNRNLDPKILAKRDNLRRAGLWDALASVSPWSKLTPEQWARVHDDEDVPLVEVAVSIDPSKGGSSRPCEVGIVGGGRDARDVLRVRHDKSGVLDGGAEGWPKASWDLAEQLHREHPAAPFPVFVFESNVGKVYGDLLFAEERARRKSRGEPGVNARCVVVPVRANADKCVRAEAPANVAARGQVRHARGLEVMEGQQRNLTPKGTDSDRADAENHLLTYLGRMSDGADAVTKEQDEANATAQCELAARLNAAMVTRRSPPAEQTDEGRLQKIDGAPVGDVRGPPRAAGRPPSWRTRSVL